MSTMKITTIKTIKALLFDFGGTIDTGGTHWSEKFWDSYSALGLPIDKKDYEAAYVAAERKMKEVTFGKNDKFSDVLGKKLEFQLEHLHNSDIINGNKSALHKALLQESIAGIQRTISKHSLTIKALASQYKLGLVSNFYGNIEEVLVEYGINNYFDFVVDSTLAKVRKPDPLIYKMAVDKTGYLPGQCAVIGDSYDKDIVPAKSLGCITFWLKGRSWKEEPDSEKADFIISDFSQLENTLLSYKVNHTQ